MPYGCCHEGEERLCIPNFLPLERRWPERPDEGLVFTWATTPCGNPISVLVVGISITTFSFLTTTPEC